MMIMLYAMLALVFGLIVNAFNDYAEQLIKDRND